MSSLIKFQKNWKIWVSYTILILIISLFSSVLISNDYISKEITGEEIKLDIILSDFSRDISHMIENSEAQLNSIKNFVLKNNTKEYLDANFTNYVEGLYLSQSAIRNYIIAPNGVNTYVYPLEGNEEAIGHVIINDTRPEVKEDITRALQTQNITMSIPYELRQGGLGLVFRLAIFIDGEFWGIISMVIDIPVIFEQINIKPDIGLFLFAIRDIEGNVFFGNPNTFEENSIEMKIELPEYYWTLAGLPKEGWMTLIFPNAWFTLILIWITGITLTILIYLIVDKTYMLRLKSSIYIQHYALTEEKIRNFIENASDAIFISELGDNFILVNQRAIEMTGYSKEELLEMKVVDIILPSDQDKFNHINAELIKNSQILAELKMVTKSGNIISAEVSMNLTEDNEIQSIVRDITEKKKRLINLELLVENRTLELTLANRDLESFASSASHDLRAPLRALQGISELLIDEYTHKLDEIGKNYLSRINNAAIKMDKIIVDLLSYSKLSQKGLSLTSIKIENIIDEVISNYEDQINEKHAIINVRRPTNNVMGTYPVLMQVIDNMLSNALKYSFSDRQVKINIWSEKIGDRIRIWVEDNGIGISEEYLESIYDPFKRLHSDEQFEGTGLGLAIVQRGTIKMGGNVGVISEEGKYSKFWIELKEG